MVYLLGHIFLKTIISPPAHEIHCDGDFFHSSLSKSEVFGDEFGDEFVTKFGDKFGESPNLVTDMVTNLVMNLVNHRMW